MDVAVAEVAILVVAAVVGEGLLLLLPPPVKPRSTPVLLTDDGEGDRVRVLLWLVLLLLAGVVAAAGEGDRIITTLLLVRGTADGEGDVMDRTKDKEEDFFVWLIRFSGDGILARTVAMLCAVVEIRVAVAAFVVAGLVAVLAVGSEPTVRMLRLLVATTVVRSAADFVDTTVSVDLIADAASLPSS